MENLKILSDYLNYLKVLKFSKVYYNSLNVFFKEFIIPKGIEFENVTREDITEYLAIKEYSPNSLNTFVKAGRHIFKNFLRKEDNVFNSIKLVQVERKIPDYISEEQLKRGIDYALITVQRYNHRKVMALLKFMFYSGLRKSEILNLKRNDFELEKNPIEIKVRVPTKGKAERLVFIPYSLRVMMYQYFNSEVEKGNAFNLCSSSLDYIVRIFAECFPDKNISAHTFRHSYAKDLIKNGMDVTIVSKLLGHKNIETTLIYVNPDEDMMREIYKVKKIIGE